MAGKFQKVVLTIAIILLLFTLVFIALALKNSKEEAVWPPLVGDCPDYWLDLSGNGAACVNKLSLGTCNLPSDDNDNAMDFTVAPFTGSNDTCSKYMWANNCKVTWDGINSGVPNPCANGKSSN